MAIDAHVRRVAAEVTAQDAELLEEFANRAKWGQGDYAVAYAVLRAVQTVGRFVAAACMDDDERAVVQRPPDAGAEATSPAPDDMTPGPAERKGRTRPANGT